MTDIPHIHPISARAVEPMSKDEWSEQFKTGALYPEVGTAAWFAEFNRAVYNSAEWWRMAEMESAARSKLPRGPKGQLGEFEAVKIEGARISAELDAAKAEGRVSRVTDPEWQWNHEAARNEVVDEVLAIIENELADQECAVELLSDILSLHHEREAIGGGPGYRFRLQKAIERAEQFLGLDDQ